LQAWASLDGGADIVIEDDASEVSQLRALLPHVAARCDLLLGPYSTVLMRAAGELAGDLDWIVWNHGGSGDDVETAQPGHVVSMLTPTSRYARPFLNHLAASGSGQEELWIAHGTGRFGRQVARGAEAYAWKAGLTRLKTGPAATLFAEHEVPESWILLTAGTFEDDIQTVTHARGLKHPPRLICAVAAGVREFGTAIPNPTGTLGIAQWFPHVGQEPRLGPTEERFLAAYGSETEPPDYPAVQAAATAALAAHCAREAGSTRREDLWQAATALETTTLFGEFKIDPSNGKQIRHQTILIQWTDSGPAALHVAVRRENLGRTPGRPRVRKTSRKGERHHETFSASPSR